MTDQNRITVLGIEFAIGLKGQLVLVQHPATL